MLINPYDTLNNRTGTWLKANFHTHAGVGGFDNYNIEDVIFKYKEAGYDILTFSNQNVLSDAHQYESKYGMLLFNSMEYVE